MHRRVPYGTGDKRAIQENSEKIVDLSVVCPYGEGGTGVFRVRCQEPGPRRPGGSGSFAPWSLGAAPIAAIAHLSGLRLGGGWSAVDTAVLR